MAITKKVITATLVRSGYYYNEFPIEVTLTYTGSDVTNITAILKNPNSSRKSNFWKTDNYWVGVKSPNDTSTPIYGAGAHEKWFATFGAHGDATASVNIPSTNHELGKNPSIVVNTDDHVAATPGEVRYMSIKVYENGSDKPSHSIDDGEGTSAIYSNSIVKIHS